ncbi:MAG: trehalose-phosphatase [Deltaproteobacteria bacterium]
MSSSAYRDAEQRCTTLALHDQLTVLLDLDGTLIPFAPTPEAATIDEASLELLRALHGAGVQVEIVSGRPHEQLAVMRERIPEIAWVAEHGAWRCDPHARWCGPATEPELGELVELLGAFARVPGVRLETKSLGVCLHWRLVPSALKEDLISAVELACDEWLESHPEHERLDGVEMLEVRRRSANKSLAVARVRERRPGSKIIAIGDDRTDEDMFSALTSDELAIGVGEVHVRGHYSLRDPREVHAFLGWLVAARTVGIRRPFRALNTAGLGTARPPRARLVVVSNRTPPASTSRHRPVGGLVSALEPALRAHDGIWLGWSGKDSAGARPVVIDTSSRPVVASFDFATSWRDRFYAGFCNRALWPLFHGFPERVRYSDDDWNAYREANAEFARHASDLVAPAGTVWAHDYHLLLLGRELRGRGFRGPIGLFLHIPFPQRDLFATLPWSDDLVDAMLDFDVLGFHTEQWAQNFRECVRTRNRNRMLPRIAVLPIGVDPAGFIAGTEPIDREVGGLRAAIGSRRLILGVDRLDYAKGIPERLHAFERLLETRPEWRSRVCFVQISVPSRADVPEYAELKHRVETLVGRINGRFGEADWVPVRYLYRSYDQHVLAQLYRASDVALVTPLRDGLNLVAKEFIVAQDPAQPGVLVLSRFAGAAAELTDAVITNPFHVDGLAADIDRALRMELPERVRRHARLAGALAEQTPQRWAQTFLDHLVSGERSVA